MKLFNKLLLISIITLCISCKKKESDMPVTKTELLTSKSWKLVAFKYHYNNDAWIEGFSKFPVYAKDDLTIYSTDHTYQLTEGATKKNSSDPQVYQTGTWAFNANETQIILTSSYTIDTLQIDELTTESFKYHSEKTLTSTVFHLDASYTHE